MNAWVNDPVAAEAMYGHIKWWDTGAVTDMSDLLYDKATFQEDLAHW